MKPLLAEFLSEIERREATLLAWGLVDGAMADAEIYQIAEDFLRDHDPTGIFADPYALIEEMMAAGLCFRWEEHGNYRYRSRMAEALRLLARLRQMFPRHLAQPGDWARSPTLVADFRFQLRAREYPRRDLAPLTCLGRWVEAGLRISATQQAALRALLGVSTERPMGFPVAGFQDRATERILNRVNGGGPTGTMISAGTGSGKTLAFYLPALTHLAGMLERDASPWTRVMALYPRNELLKDQLTETIRQARWLKPALAAARLRPICVGAYFGPTPHASDKVTADGKQEWESRQNGRVCPFVVCPEPQCGGALIWLDDDRERGVERLMCEVCDSPVEANEIMLTRKRMLQSPPDVLFTTTEMMNQRLTDSSAAHLFGVGTAANRKPTLVLLDEAHTYTGTHGAQVAYLLRRWRHMSQANCHWVGLSATLMEAGGFFSQLTGLPTAGVEEVSPESGEMMKEGMEYLVALRGDPVSGASLMATTLQSVMLLRRALDPPGQPLSGGVYGQKIFLFTDDLDVKNRLYFNLLDAEGQDSYGRPAITRHPNGSLANLRATTYPDEERRFAFGQSWRLAEDLGHALSPQRYVRIGRVSSQDSGVDGDAEIIVATASLEVGFNDPTVGAVLQHKAPREAASFLQRKGRAGRPREMRPWTVVVLSDFGRDRLAYQGYDLLFDPELSPQELPLGNQHVLKMQAVASAMDWIATQVARVGPGHVWQEASAPAQQQNEYFTARRQERQTATAQVLARLLAGGDELESLSEWLYRSLRLSKPEEVKALLWEAPRALMTEVLPTWHRRVATQWQRGSIPGGEYHRFNHPLPEFLPATLFSELNLPEVMVMACPGPGQPEESHAMTAAAALREFAPGRISRRFGISHSLSRHWIPVDLTAGPDQTLDIGTFCGSDERDDLGLVEQTNPPRSIRVFRPWVLHVRDDAPRNQVKDSSNAFLVWHSQLLAPQAADAGLALDLPTPSPWTGVLEELRFFTHRQHQPITIRRFATGSRATINGVGGQSTDFAVRWVTREPGRSEEDVALGFAFEADALRLRVRIPVDWRFAATTQFAEKLPALRAARFRWRLLHESRFDGFLNTFERGWIAEVALGAINALAVRDRLTLAGAWTALRAGTANLSLQTVLDVVFQTLPTEEDDQTARVEQDRLQELRQTLASPLVLAVLDDEVPTLWQAPGATWQLWLAERFLVTLGAACRDAIQQVCPESDVQSLLVDLVPGTGDMADIWISEDTPGGGGIIERLLPLVAESPRRFLDLLHGALGESDYETADTELRQILRRALDPTAPELARALAAVREAPTLAELTETFRRLRAHLQDQGIRSTHAVIAGLTARILRPGSNAETDRLGHELMERWRAEEARLGVELDARSLAFALSFEEDLDAMLHGGLLPIGPDQDRRTWRFNAIAGMIWPRGSQARNQALTLRSPYTNLLPPERLLVLDALGSRHPIVRFGAADWRAQCERQLIEQGRIALVGTRAELGALRAALVGLLANALDLGSLLVYPRLRGLEQGQGEIVAILELVSAGQVAPPPEAIEATTTARLIVKTARGSRDEVRDLLESLFAIELLAPSDELWLVSPWVSDLGILDNRSGNYAGLEPAWPKRHISLAELCVFALQKNPRAIVRIISRPADHNRWFCDRVQALATLEGVANRLLIDRNRPELHLKGLVTTGFALNGSMNFTRNGVEVLDEAVQLETDAAWVAQFGFNLHGHYG